MFVVVVFVVLAILAGAGLVAVTRSGRTPQATSSTPRPPLARAVPPAAVESAADRRSDALNALLASRASAVLHRDRAGFLASVDPAAPAFRRSQQRLFDALGALRFSSWRYDIDASAPGRAVPNPARFRGATETYAPRTAAVRYQLASYDVAATSTRVGLTFVRRGARWLIAADSDFDRTTAGTQREVWDYGPLTAIRGPRTLVIGRPADRQLLYRLRAEAERGIPRVTAVWGRGWASRVVIAVPASQSELAAILRKPYGSLSRMAAVATAELGSLGHTAAVGNRILINPANVDRLGALGRQVVITHEITHVATRAATAAGTPTWLVEGFADYVAYRSARLPVAAAAPELRTAVRADRIPRELPADRDFAGSNPRLAQVYEEAWLAVRLIADRAGPGGLLRFYRAAASGPGGLAAALASELGLSPAGFTALWRRYLIAELS